MAVAFRISYCLRRGLLLPAHKQVRLVTSVSMVKEQNRTTTLLTVFPEIPVPVRVVIPARIPHGNVSSTTALGTTQSLVSVDALQEFRVNSSTYSAEYGRTPGGQFFIRNSLWHQ